MDINRKQRHTTPPPFTFGAKLFLWSFYRMMMVTNDPVVVYWFYLTEMAKVELALQEEKVKGDK